MTKKESHEIVKRNLYESIAAILENQSKIQEHQSKIREMTWQKNGVLTVGDIYAAQKEFDLSNEMTCTIFGMGRCR